MSQKWLQFMKVRLLQNMKRKYDMVRNLEIYGCVNHKVLKLIKSNIEIAKVYFSSIIKPTNKIFRCVKKWA